IDREAACRAAVSRLGGRPMPGDCIVDANTDGITGQGDRRVQRLKGNDLPNAPRNKIGLAVNYTWQFDPGSLTGSLSYSWRDNTYGTLFKRWYTKAPTWDQVDGRFLWKDVKGKYEIIAYIKNIFDT